MASPVRMNALIVGSGWSRHAAHAFQRRDDVQVRGLVARGSSRSFALARALRVPLFATVADAVRQITPILAVVAVGDRQNGAFTLELLEAGAHVLCAHPVAPTPEEVMAIAEAAERRGLFVSTDYSLRATEAFRVGRAAIQENGTLLRLDVTYPGRFLPIALDLAVALGGHVDTVSAFGRYPKDLHARREAAPAVFPPTTILEHLEGVVSALTPSPHADPRAALRITASSTGGRVDIALPTGGARRLRCGHGGRFEEIELTPAVRGGAAGAAFGDAMRTLADRFVDAIVHGEGPPCPLADEAHLRRLWMAITRAERGRRPVTLGELTPST